MIWFCVSELVNNPIETNATESSASPKYPDSITADFRVAEGDQDQRKDSRQRDHDQHEGRGRDEFAGDDFTGAHRRGKQKLIGAGAFFLGETAHRDRGHQDHQHDRKIMQQRSITI